MVEDNMKYYFLELFPPPLWKLEHISCPDDWGKRAASQWDDFKL